MSTSIATGFRYTASSLPGQERAVASLWHDLMPGFEAYVQQRERQRVMDLALRWLDRATLSQALGPSVVPNIEDEDNGRIPTSLWDRAIEDLRQRQAVVRETHARDATIDTELSLTLWPHPSGHSWLGILSEEGERTAWQQVLKHPGVQSYTYWNGTDDVDAGVSQEAWDQRGQDWDRVLNDPSIVARRQSWTFQSQAHPRLRSALKDRLSLKQRVQRSVNTIVHQEWALAHPVDGDRPSAYMGQWMDFVDACQNDPKVRSRIDEWTLRVTPLLIDEPTALMQALSAEPSITG